MQKSLTFFSEKNISAADFVSMSLTYVFVKVTNNWARIRLLCVTGQDFDRKCCHQLVKHFLSVFGRSPRDQTKEQLSLLLIM